MTNEESQSLENVIDYLITLVTESAWKLAALELALSRENPDLYRHWMTEIENARSQASAAAEIHRLADTLKKLTH